MMPRFRRSPLALVVAGTVLAGCSGSDAPTAPTAGEPVNVAQLFGELAPPGATNALLLSSGLSLPATSAAIGASCPYDAASKSFVCAPVTSSGLTVTTSYQLLDAAGKPQDASADRRTTAAMHTVSTIAGTLTLPPGTGTTAAGPLTISGKQDMTLSGLLGSTHTLNGTATTTMRGTFTLGSAVTTLSTATTQTMRNVVYPAAAATASAPQYPTSGTITIDGTSTFGTATPAVTTHLEMTFNGTSTATLIMSTGGSTERCTINLATQAPPVCTAG